MFERTELEYWLEFGNAGSLSTFALVTDLFENLKFEAASDHQEGIEHWRDRPFTKHKAPFRQAQNADRVASE